MRAKRSWNTEAISGVGLWLARFLDGELCDSCLPKFASLMTHTLFLDGSV